MSRRALKFQCSQEVAVSKQREGTQGDRKQHITDFFKPTCTQDEDELCSALRSPINNKRLKPQNMDSSESNRSPPFKRQRNIPQQSPSKSPIIEAFLRSRKDTQAIVRNLQTFCAKCGMNVLSPKVVIERLSLPMSPVVNLKEGFKQLFNSSEAVSQSLSSLKSCLQSRNESPLNVSEKSHFNQQLFDERSQTLVSGQKAHSPQQPFFLVDSWASRNRSHGGITKKKTTQQVVSLGKAKGHELLAKVNGTSLSSTTTSKGTYSLASEKESDIGFESVSPLPCTRPTTSESKIFNCSTPDTSVNSSKKVIRRLRRDSVDSEESFHAFSLSSDEEKEETLKPLDEIMQIVAQPVPATPQKEDLSLLSLSQSPERGTPVNNRLKELLQTPSYDNNLELLVKEKKESERIDAIEKQLHKDLEIGRGVADEKRDSSQDGELTDEHRDILNKFSVVINAIPDRHPGEKIFHLPKSGAIFNISTLNLQHLKFTADSSEEMIVFRPGNQVMLATEGFLTTLYQYKKCPEVLMRWMFQMVSVHPSYATSIKLLHTLIEIICNHLTNQKGKPWVPTLLDIATVFANMGIEFKTLFPLPHIQPAFSALDLKSAVPGSVSAEQQSICTEQIFYCIPEFQIAHIIKFLSLCTAVYKESYLDLEILALLVMLLNIHLEKEMKDIPVMDLHCLIAHLLQNIVEWVTIMPELCFAMSELTNHHHNFLRLLQLIPTFEFRGRELRRHVSLIFISNILTGQCTDIPLDYESRMLLLCKCLFQMKPSSLVKKMKSLPEYESKTLADLDQEAYYLTFSLLHLVNDASSSDEPPSIQREYLLKLGTELEKHIKSDIREDARFFYRTKVKDLVARLYGRWQELLLYSQPKQGKLHDYWQPGCDSSSPSSSLEGVDEACQGDSLSDH